jgi:hypothetical protein
MLKVITCITCCTFLLAMPQEQEKEKARPVHAPQPSVGLTLVTRTGDGFALAADGAQANADGTLSQVQKLFPVGKNGALVLAGTVSIQDPVDRPVREELNVANIADGWLKGHPDADIKTAAREIKAQIADTATKFFAKRQLGAAPGKYAFAVIFVGFANGKPWSFETRYFIPAIKGKPMRAEQTLRVLAPGEIQVFGSSKVEQELISGTSAALKEFKAEAPIRRFRSQRSRKPTLQDYLDLFDVILRASESEQGKTLTSGRLTAAPPNRFATLSATDGFMWGKVEAK